MRYKSGRKENSRKKIILINCLFLVKFLNIKNFEKNNMCSSDNLLDYNL